MKNAAEILSAIHSGEILKSNSHSLFIAAGYVSMTVDINAFPAWLDRWAIQTVKIEDSKRGNLAKFAGKTVEIIATTVQRGAPRINFWIKEVL